MALSPGQSLQLRSFLESSFNVDELGIFLRDNDYAEIDALALKRSSDEVYFDSVVLALDRKGAITTRFFAALEERFPARLDEVNAIKASLLAPLGGGGDPPPDPDGIQSIPPIRFAVLWATVATALLLALGMAVYLFYKNPPYAAGPPMSASEVAVLGASWPIFFVAFLGLRRWRDAREHGEARTNLEI